MLSPTYNRNLTSYFARSQPSPQRILRKNIGHKSFTHKAINRRPHASHKTLIIKADIIKHNSEKVSLVFNIRPVRCASKPQFQNTRPKTIPFTAQRTGTYSKQHCPMLRTSRPLSLVHVSTLYYSIDAIQLPSNSLLLCRAAPGGDDVDPTIS